MRVKEQHDPSEELLRAVSLRGVRLKRVVLQTPPVGDGEAELVHVVRHNTLELGESAHDSVTVKLTERVGFEPKGPFSLELELEGNYLIRDTDIDRKKVESRLQVLGAPVLQTASMLVGILSEKVLGVPILLPPVLVDEKPKPKRPKRTGPSS